MLTCRRLDRQPLTITMVSAWPSGHAMRPKSLQSASGGRADGHTSTARARRVTRAAYVMFWLARLG